MDQIREGRYAPAAVKRVWIPKPDGTKRPLGIPTVLDRVIQQAIAQVLSPLFDADFSEDTVNQDKSKVAPLGECSFLGFNVRGKQIRRTEKAAKRFKTRIQEITSRSRGISMRQRLLELKRYCAGWFHYFKIGLSFKEVREWDGWIRRRIRLCYWFRAKRQDRAACGTGTRLEAAA